jgi:DNA-binding transcriptional LysR family regulator
MTVAAPAYWARHGKPEHPDELRGHVCIAYALASSPHRWDYVGADGEAIAVDVTCRVDCNSAELECALAVAGVGVTRMPEFSCAREIAEGLLEPVLEEFARARMGIYAVYPHRRHVSPKVRAFVDFLVAEFGG